MDGFSVKEITGYGDKMVDVLAGLEEKCLPLEMRNADGYGYFSQALNDSKVIVLLLNFKERPVGFLVAKEYNDSYPELCNNDPDLENCKKDFFYIETVQINPRYYRGKKGLKLLSDELISRVKDHKFRGICTYARTKNGLSDLFRRYFNGKKLRSIDNWFGFQEKFDYLEVRF